jgi:hypothetical protein
MVHSIISHINAIFDCLGVQSVHAVEHVLQSLIIIGHSEREGVLACKLSDPIVYLFDPRWKKC